MVWVWIQGPVYHYMICSKGERIKNWTNAHWNTYLALPVSNLTNYSFIQPVFNLKRLVIISKALLIPLLNYFLLPHNKAFLIFADKMFLLEAKKGHEIWGFVIVIRNTGWEWSVPGLGPSSGFLWKHKVVLILCLMSSFRHFFPSRFF